jgi:hypothetical protein
MVFDREKKLLYMLSTGVHITYEFFLSLGAYYSAIREPQAGSVIACP